MTPFNPRNVNIDWYKWRPILEGVATLHEVNTLWDINDLADANEALDIKTDSEAHYARQQK